LPPVISKGLIDGERCDLLWEPDIPARALQRPITVRANPEFALPVEDWWTPAQVAETLHSEPIVVDADRTHANLIAFPRELVAPRKMRPRLAVATPGSTPDPEAQLSIFEVDPGTVSTKPVIETLTATPSEPAWSGSVWSDLELDAHPVREEAPSAEASAHHGPYLAPLGTRLMAMMVDGSLILASFFTVAIWIASRLSHLPAPKAAEAIAVAGLLLTGFAYNAVFFMLAGITPGMRYAGIALCTFDDNIPTRLQLRRRLAAMALSLLPVGLGMVWSVFDEDHLSWHDRISGTYLRRP
jgi:uncharacterized RDD family membrane protein YckC